MCVWQCWFSSILSVTFCYGECRHFSFQLESFVAAASLGWFQPFGWWFDGSFQSSTARFLQLVMLTNKKQTHTMHHPPSLAFSLSLSVSLSFFSLHSISLSLFLSLTSSSSLLSHGMEQSAWRHHWNPKIINGGDKLGQHFIYQPRLCAHTKYQPSHSTVKCTNEMWMRVYLCVWMSVCMSLYVP